MTAPSVPPSDPDLDLAPASVNGAHHRRPLGVAVVGCGYWGPNLVRNFAEVPGARVVAVSDLQQARLAPIAARYPSVRTTTDHRELLRDPAVEAIAIATPVSTHYELARQALEAGRHVLVEKPMATSSDEAQRLIELAGRRGLVLMVDHTFVYTGSVQRIKELVDAGELGRLYYWDSTRVNLGLFQHDVSVLADLAVHDLSIMDHVLEARPAAVSATGIAHVPGQPVNTAYLTLFFDHDLLAHFHVNWLAPVKVRRTLVGGDRRMIVYDDIEPSEKVKVYDRGITLAAEERGRFEMLVGYRAGDMWAPRLSLTEALRVEAQHFVDCVLEGRRPITDGWAGYRVVRILEAAARSLADRGRLVELDWRTTSGADADPAPRPAGAVPEPQTAH
jgi:predicted dehydrogenase